MIPTALCNNSALYPRRERKHNLTDTILAGVTMSENEVKKCPKCNGEMEKGRSLIATHAHFWEVLLSKKSDWYGDKVIPLYCKKCGYIELYKEM